MMLERFNGKGKDLSLLWLRSEWGHLEKSAEGEMFEVLQEKSHTVRPYGVEREERRSNGHIKSFQITAVNQNNLFLISLISWNVPESWLHTGFWNKKCFNLLY